MPARHRQKRGLHALLWAAGAFVVMQLCASIVFDYALPRVRFPALFEQVERVNRLEPAPIALSLGSSRTGCLIDEAELSLVTRELTGDGRVQFGNVAVPAGDLVVSEQVLKQMLDAGARPRYVFIELSPEALASPNAWLRMHVGRTLVWGDVPAYLGEVVWTGNLQRFAGTRLLPLYVYRDEIRRGLADFAFGAEPLPQTFSSAASMPAPTKETVTLWQDRIEKELRDARPEPDATMTLGLDLVQKALRDYRPGGNAARALERSLELCRQHRIEAILLGIPLSSNHRNCYTPQIEAAYQEYVQALTRKHGCRFIDCLGALPDQLFTDHHHTSLVGRRIFSRKLGLEVVAPLLNDASRPPPAVTVGR